MMNIPHISKGLLVVFVLILFSSCEHQLQMKTKVYPDGRLDKSIVFISNDSVENTIQYQYLGVNSAKGWNLTREVMNDTTTETSFSGKPVKVEKNQEFKYAYQKSFTSAAEANAELAQPSDSLFRVTSVFDKKFRWFYTYLTYQEIYHAINRFQLPITDYFTAQDFDFIAQLPPEGNSISKADSLFLDGLMNRIYDYYGSRGYFEEYYSLLLEVNMTDTQREQLILQKEEIYHTLTHHEEIEDDFLPLLADSLGIILDTTSSAYQQKVKRIESKLKFMSWASDGKYNQVIDMPGELVSHNADSVQGNVLMWSPPAIKFMLRDYTFQAESRQRNNWAWGVSVLVLLMSIFLLIRKKR
jgi:hypothetical protein